MPVKGPAVFDWKDGRSRTTSHATHETHEHDFTWYEKDWPGTLFKDDYNTANRNIASLKSSPFRAGLERGKRLRKLT